MNTHGGAGRGQGRKRTGRERINVMVDQELLNRLPANGKRSDFINEAIRYYLDHKPQNKERKKPSADEVPSQCVVVEITDYEVVKSYNGGKFVRLFFPDDTTFVFRLSLKQFQKLGQDYTKVMNAEDVRFKPKLLCVIEGDHYVWSGLEYVDYSDRSFLEETFKAVSVDKIEIEESITVHVPEKKDPIHVEPHPSLVR